ncbi:MAG TPA: DNA repair protein RecN [Clostridiales bacterium]|nr:DNA repair protein RecN [Clostridiales bacterium]
MLRQLSISNIALIDNLNMELGSGLNILTGETGAGKSIIIDAINLILGERANRDLITTDKKFAYVEAIFDVPGDCPVGKLLDRYGISFEQDNTLIFSREITQSGKNTCRINGRAVTLSALKEISGYLIDIHGQHHHHTLLDESNNLSLIDLFGGLKINSIKIKLEALYKKWKDILLNLNRIKKDESNRERNIDLINYQLKEIYDAHLTIGEDKQLLAKKNLLSNLEKIKNVLEDAYVGIYSGDGYTTSVIDILGNIKNNISEITSYNPQLEKLHEDIENIFYFLEDIALNIRQFKENIDFSPRDLEEIDMRLDTINKLKRKYGREIEDILDFAKSLEKQLKALTESKESMEKYEQDRRLVQQELLSLCKKLSGIRKERAKQLEKRINEELRQLGMAKAKFIISFNEQPAHNEETKITANGFDNVEFLLAPNPGHPPKPLAKIISGGELSRVMLAIKNIFASSDNIPTLIFDEIDTGISGATAEIVGQKLSSISKFRQVICVTHLPQIACLANHHFVIEKKVIDNRTITQVKLLDYHERIKEIAKMISGTKVTELTMDHARQMIDRCSGSANG